MLEKGKNSYATLEEAELYFGGRLDVAAWTAADDSQKEQALLTATMMFSEVLWVGVAASDDQLLAFPRVGSYLEPILGKIVNINPSVIPVRMVNACCEQAYHLLNNDGMLDDSSTPESIRVDVIQLSGLNKDASQLERFSTMANTHYYPLTWEGYNFLSRQQSGNGFAWWRAN